MRVIKIGCCGFPAARSKYYETFGVVEVQKTFYDPPRQSTLARWRREAPEDFEFTLKAWQLITHEPRSPTYRRLRRALPPGVEARYGSFRPTDEVLGAWDKTREAAEALRARIIVFQCPPSFGPSEENIRNMRRFFGGVSREGLLFAWEPRGGWECGLVAEVCRDLDLVHVVDPFRGRGLHGSIAYWRLHGIGGYRSRYSGEDLRRLRALVDSGKDSYIMFNNSSMFEDAREFQRLVGDVHG